jgi:polyketide cyclase/dehydrase/lipid transport protein
LRWFRLQPIDEGFFDAAPQRYVAEIDIPLPAERVWADLTGDAPLAWCRMLTRIDWTSPRPFGVDTTRTARLGRGALVINERFFRWEEGRRKSFCVVEASLPLFRRLGEDYLVEATSATSCQFTWTLAAEPVPAARPGAPVNALLARSLFRDTRRHFGVR